MPKSSPLPRKLWDYFQNDYYFQREIVPEVEKYQLEPVDFKQVDEACQVDYKVMLVEFSHYLVALNSSIQGTQVSATYLIVIWALCHYH